MGVAADYVSRTKIGAYFHSIRESRKLILFIVAVALLLDNMLLTTVGKKFNSLTLSWPHPAKMDLNKKWLPKQKTNQNFNIDAQGFRNTRNEIPSTWEIRVTT